MCSRCGEPGFCWGSSDSIPIGECSGDQGYHAGLDYEQVEVVEAAGGPVELHAKPGQGRALTREVIEHLGEAAGGTPEAIPPITHEQHHRALIELRDKDRELERLREALRDESHNRASAAKAAQRYAEDAERLRDALETLTFELAAARRIKAGWLMTIRGMERANTALAEVASGPPGGEGERTDG